MNCTTINGVLVNNFNNGIQCFTGEHLVHAVIAIVILIAFVPFTIAISLIFYESRTMAVQDITSRTHSHYETLMLSLKTILSILLLVIKGTSSQWVIALVLFAGTWLLTYAYAFDSRFYHKTTCNFASCFTLLNLWIAFIYCFQLILGTTTSTGAAELLVLGCPLVICAIFLNRNKNWMILSKAIHNVNNPDESLQKIIAFIHLLSKKGINVINYII